MTALSTLIAVARGRRPDDERLVQTCRLWAGGRECYGEEAIIAAFADDPVASVEHADAVTGQTSLALFAHDTAIVTDIQSGAVIRIWRLGPGAVQPCERAISVPLDTDLAQARADVFFAASDHPDIDPLSLNRLIAQGRDLARQSRWHGGRLHRCRAFLIRAFGDGNTIVGLFALHLMGGEAVRSAGFSYAVVRLGDDGGSQVYRDIAGDAAAAIRPWRPRVA